MMCKYFILSIIIVLIIAILLKINKKESFMAPSDVVIKEIQIEENKDKFKKFQDIQSKILSDYSFQIGYKELESTNKKSIGFCPLGTYYNNNIDNELGANNLSKCKTCTKCESGYYLKEGCTGNSNSVCQQDKVPHEIYLGAHGDKKEIHGLINPHQHPYFYETNNSGEQSFLLSSLNHNHI